MIAFQHADVEVMHGFQCFAARSVYTFDLVPYMAIAVLLRKLCWRTIRRPMQLPNQFESLMTRPALRQLADVDMQLTKLVIHLKVLDAHELGHVPSPEP
jgi:hypothetical protein